MIFERLKKDKKAQTVKVIVMLVVGLVVVGIMIYMGYKYILGTGKSVGALASCEGQGGDCGDKSCTGLSNRDAFLGMGCPSTDAEKTANKKYCCISKDRAG